MHNTRRDFLRAATAGTGALTLAPSFGNLIAATTTSNVPTRFVFIRKSNGQRPNELALPTFTEQQKKLEAAKEPFEVDLNGHELPKWLQALAPYKANLSILQGLSTRMSENGHYSYSSVMGCFRSSANSLSGIKRATIDFELAKLFPSPFGHVELALRGNYKGFAKGIISGYSASGPQRRNYCYADPESAYNDLFKCVVNPNATSSDNQMFAFLQAEEAFKAKTLPGYEKRKLDSLVNAVDAMGKRNQKLASLSGAITKHLPTLDKVHLNGGDGANLLQKQEAMTDVLCATLISGLSNVVTYTVDELPTPAIGLPGNEADFISLHEIGHNKAYGGVPANEIRKKVRVEHVRQIARIVERLKAAPEGDGSVFDNTVITYFPEGGETHHAHGWEAPFIILTGDKVKLNLAGRYVRLPYHGKVGHQTLGNWYTTLLNAHGNPIPHYGDLDAGLVKSKIPQTGAIKQLMT
jgi:hypothetical protein